jgi:MEMO1 family protein
VLKIKKPSVADKFYPQDPIALSAMLDGFLSQVTTDNHYPKAMIVPHAGLIYSGIVAAKAYKCLEKMPHINNIILLGPSHYTRFSGFVYLEADFFETPLGNLKVNRKAIDKVKSLLQVSALDEAFYFEHCLEVQLPFIKKLLPEVEITPFLLGQANAMIVSEVLELLWGDENTLILVSSDLSHYQDYETANYLDRKTSESILALASDEIGELAACGRVPIRGLLYLAKKYHMQAKQLMQLNSGDTAGDKQRVVGYGAYHFYERILE